MTQEEIEAQEREADELAFRWFNEHVAARANPYLLAITHEEIELAQARSQAVMQRLVNGA